MKLLQTLKIDSTRLSKIHASNEIATCNVAFGTMFTDYHDSVRF